MNKQAQSTIGDVDVVLYVVEPDKHQSPAEQALLARLSESKIPAILVINKTDASTAEKIGETIRVFAALHEFAAVVPLSALKGQGTDALFSELAPFCMRDRGISRATNLPINPSGKLPRKLSAKRSCAQ